MWGLLGFSYEYSLQAVDCISEHSVRKHKSTLEYVWILEKRKCACTNVRVPVSEPWRHWSTGNGPPPPRDMHYIYIWTANSSLVRISSSVNSMWLRYSCIFVCMLVFSLRDRAGQIIILHFFFSSFWKKICLFRNSYTISSIIVAWETRLTENGISPEQNLGWCKLNASD